MKYYEWSVSDDYPEQRLSLRFAEQQVHNGRELSTVDIYSFLPDPPPRIYFSALDSCARWMDIEQAYDVVHSPGGILISNRLRPKLARSAPGDIQWIEAVLDDGANQFLSYSLAVPVNRVNALDLSRTRQILMPSGTQLPISPYFYLAGSLQPYNVT